MWFKKPKPTNDDFPEEFQVQRIGVTAAKDLADKPPAELARYLRDHLDIAKDLLHESQDKRYNPSTFITEEGSGFRVGWLSSEIEYKCMRRFSNLEDAATDYLLFSLGKGRWNGPLARNPLLHFLAKAWWS